MYNAIYYHIVIFRKTIYIKSKLFINVIFCLMMMYMINFEFVIFILWIVTMHYVSIWIVSV